MAYGLSLLGRKTEGSGEFLILSDSPGFDFMLKVEAEPDQARVTAILAFIASLRSYPGLDIKELRIITRQDGFQALLVPSRFVSATTNLMPALPGGIQFYWAKSSMEYDFRVLASRIFVRVKGIYTNCDDLGVLTARILADPQAYILATSPLLILQRLQEAEARLDAIDKSIAGPAEAPGATASPGSAHLSVLETRLEALEAKAAENEATIAALKAESFSMGQNAIKALNGKKALPDAAVAKVIELRRAEPKLDKAVILEKLKEAGLVLQPKELDMVLLVFFGGL
jgi:hypothetical protein